MKKKNGKVKLKMEGYQIPNSLAEQVNRVYSKKKKKR